MRRWQRERSGYPIFPDHRACLVAWTVAGSGPGGKFSGGLGGRICPGRPICAGYCRICAEVGEQCAIGLRIKLCRGVFSCLYCCGPFGGSGAQNPACSFSGLGRSAWGRIFRFSQGIGHQLSVVVCADSFSFPRFGFGLRVEALSLSEPLDPENGGLDSRGPERDFCPKEP